MTKNQTKITLVRHGETDWNAVGRWQGHYDSELNANGIRQAHQVGKHLAQSDIRHIFSSDLSRAHQTATIINEQLGLPIQTDPLLREIDVGKWQGMTTDEIKTRYPQAFEQLQNTPLNMSFPEGESRAEQAERGITILNHIVTQHAGEHSLLVTHGGTIKMILHRLFPQLDLPHVPNCSRTCLIHQDNTWQITQLPNEED